MPQLITVLNKWRNTSRQKKVIAPAGVSHQSVIETVKAKEPFIRADETFAVIEVSTITEAEAKVIGGQFGVITMHVREREIRSKRQLEKI